MIDAHHHLWDPARREYPWMGDELRVIRRRFGPDDLRPLLVDNGIDQTIVVQTVSSVDETREFLDTAAKTDFIAGVVGWVDLTSPSVADQLASLVGDLMGRGVGFEICEITLKNRNLKKEQFILGPTFTPSGVVRIAKLQAEEHYAYIKP